MMEDEWIGMDDNCPNDGTPLLLFIPDARRGKDQIQVGWSTPIANAPRFWVIGNQMGVDVGKPTHYQRISPPKKSE